MALAAATPENNHSLATTVERRITAIVAAVDGYELVADLLRCLDGQTARAQMEILVISPWPEQFAARPVLREGDRVESCAEGQFLEIVRGRGVRQATTPFVALLEDHCMPEQDWIEKMLRRLEEGYPIVAGAIACANHASVLSVASTLLFYGDFVPPASGGVRRYLPGHTNAYRREALLQFGDQLEERMFSETVIMEILWESGEKFFFEGAATAHHFEASVFRSYPYVLYYSGRNVGGLRGQRLSWPARLVMAAAFPAIALRRIWYSALAYRRSGQRRANPVAVGATLIMMSFLRSIGDALGYVLGPGNSGRALSHFEHNRLRFLRPGEWAEGIARIGPVTGLARVPAETR